MARHSRLGTHLAALALVLAASAAPALVAAPHASRAVLDLAASWPLDPHPVIVSYVDRPSEADLERIAMLDGRVRRVFGLVDAVAADLPGWAVETLALDARVRWVALDARVAALDRSTASSASTTVAPSSPSTGSGSPVVAVVDSGVAPHPDLGQRLLAGLDLVTPGSDGRIDPCGHGTHVAGIVAGDGASSGGVVVGRAPTARVLPVRVLGADGTGRTSDVVAALEWLAVHRPENRVAVAVVALGHPALEPAAVDPLVAAVDVLSDAGVLVVTAAGNDGDAGAGGVWSPGTAPRALTVGAIDGDRRPFGFSSRGPTLGEHALKPDLLAPGGRTAAMRAEGSALDLAYPERRASWGGATDAYFEMGGTGAAAAFTAGLAAATLSTWPDDPGPDPDGLKSTLLSAATPISGYAPTTTGAGSIDASTPLPAPSSTAPVVLWVTRATKVGVIDLRAGSIGYRVASWADSALWSDDAIWSGALPGADAAEVPSAIDALAQPDAP